MIINGIDLTQLTPHQTKDLDFPDPVQGRLVSVDADFLAYMMSYVRPDDNKSWDDMKHNCEEFVHVIMSLAGATKVHMHLTPHSSNKGYRHLIAQLKDYQANRDGKEKPEYLHVMREWIAQRWPSTQHQNCEADDGMAEMQYKAIAEGNKHLHIIATKDKDLDMVPGLHLDWDTGEITEHEPFGEIWIEEKSSKKVKGNGQKFFWAQMLMGDTADNVSGLPALSPSARDKLDMLPESILVMRTKLANSTDGLFKIKYDAHFEAKVKDKKIGPVAAYDILKDVQNNKEAFHLVLDLYREYPDFREYRSGKPITFQQAFLSEAALLWMRRNKEDAADVKKWLQEIGR